MAYFEEFEVGTLRVTDRVVSVSDPNAANTMGMAKTDAIIVGPILNLPANTTTGVVMCTVPAGMTVYELKTQCVTTANVTCNVSIGESTDIDGWDTVVSMTGTAGAQTTADAAFVTALAVHADYGRTYTQDTNILAAPTITGTATQGSYRVILRGYFK